MPLRFHKVVATLPSSLEADSVYMVRRGAGFDMVVVDSSGQLSFPINAPIVASATEPDTTQVPEGGFWLDLTPET